MTPLDLAGISDRAYREVTIEVGDVQILVVEHDEALVIAPRGTEKDAGDILSDVRFFPWKDRDIGFCHKGFLRATQAVWPQLRDILFENTLPVWFTGHSLGGAIAILSAAKMIKVLGAAPAGITTFGAPRAGFNWIIPALADVPVTCYRRGMDTVPLLPHAWWWQGPRHPVKLTQIGKRDDPFTDHEIAGYIRDLEMDIIDRELCT